MHCKHADVATGQLANHRSLTRASDVAFSFLFLGKRLAVFLFCVDRWYQNFKSQKK
jgi:hypothetical protein